jgi:hypothetical protein
MTTQLIRLVLLGAAFLSRKADALAPILAADRQAIRTALILAPVIARHHAATDLFLRPRDTSGPDIFIPFR